MFKHILLATDGSEISQRAARTAIVLARTTGARLTALHAIPPFIPPMPDLMGAYGSGMSEAEYERITQAEAAQLLGQVAQAAKEAGVACETLARKGDPPWRLIIDVARERGCDAIVMASHGRKGVSGLILGSETTKVLTHCTVPVLVTR